MRIAIYSRGWEGEQHDDLKLLLAELARYKIEPVIFQNFFNQFYSSIPIPVKYSTFNSSEDLVDIDCIISLGGDGTLLDAITYVGNKGIPVLGINYGRLGFLASIGKDELHLAVKALTQHTFVLDKRTLLHLDANMPLFSGVAYALNEFTIHKKDTSPMIKIHTYLNGEFLNTYWADGLIVSTPTGSTGYSLSCRGPVVFPQTSSFVITPVAPHNLNTRPIVVPDDNVISFEIEGRTEQFLCTLDARTEIIKSNVQLAVKKESFKVSLVRPDEHN